MVKLLSLVKPFRIFYMPYPFVSVFSAQIETAIKDSEFTADLTRARLTAERLRELILAESQQLFSTVSTLVSDYDTLEKTLEDIKKGNPLMFRISALLGKNEFPDNNWLTFGEIVAALSFTIPPLISNLGHKWSIGIIYDMLSNSWYKLGVAVVTSILLFILLYWGTGKIRKWYLTGYYTRFFNSHDSSAIQSYETGQERLVNMDKQIIQNLQDKGIKELIRRLINGQLKLNYTIRFEGFTATGLGEVMSAGNTINTEAKEKLNFLLNSMPGGAIGIAGSRGAGKSTLIQSYCGQDRTETKIKQKAAIPVMAVAPVKYESRDFILHLFKTTCFSVLREEAGNEFVDFEKLTYEEAVVESMVDQRTLIRTIRRVLPFACAILIYLGVVGVFWGSDPGRKAHAIAVPVPEKQSNIDSVKEVSVKNKARPDSLKSLNITPVEKTDTIVDSSPGMENRILDAIIPSADTGAKLLAWAAGLFVIMFFMMFYQRTSLITPLLTSREKQARKLQQEGLMKREALKRRLEERPNLNASITWLKRIKFQQSFTTGWSGALKLPFALEGGMNKAMTFAERQMSYPEIIAAFRDYLTGLQLTYPIIIGIDELDKLESDEVAQEFLNEIKSVFGVPNCFFLISVSENAMSNFERRGMPFRDVFDSSFDSVVFVDNFTLKDTTTLLQRRVIGNPMTFFCLAYCFAGGLPRDIIRYFREIVRISTHKKTIKQITDQMVSDDIAAKIRAMIHTIKHIPESPENNELLNHLIQLKENAQTITSYQQTIQHLSTQRNAWQTKITQLLGTVPADRDTEALDLLQKTIKNNQEFHVYLCYMTTVLDLFTSSATQNKIKKIEADQVFGIMAKARQSLSVDYQLALKKINHCRRKESLAVLD
ncbi:P-loop NTPase fold protein [Mucilaginibacter sp.]|uniref:cell division protein ZapB n=1 Tax=Mucilaginibacter sp. TaxID=1882438 RepID=UPI003D095D1A